MFAGCAYKPNKDLPNEDSLCYALGRVIAAARPGCGPAIRVRPASSSRQAQWIGWIPLSWLLCWPAQWKRIECCSAEREREKKLELLQLLPALFPIGFCCVLGQE